MGAAHSIPYYYAVTGGRVADLRSILASHVEEGPEDLVRPLVADLGLNAQILQNYKHRLWDIVRGDQFVRDKTAEAIVKRLVQSTGSAQETAAEVFRELSIIALPEVLKGLVSWLDEDACALTRAPKRHRALPDPASGSGAHQNRQARERYAAAWALAEIANRDGSSKTALVQAGTVPALVRWLSEGAVRDKYPAVWALARLAQGGQDFKTALVQADAVRVLTRLLDEREALAAYPAAWALAEIADGDLSSEVDGYRKSRTAMQADAVSALTRLLYVGDIHQKWQAAAALGNIASGDQTSKSALLQAGAVPSLVWLLNWGNLFASFLAARALYSIAQGDQNSKAALLQAAVVPALLWLLSEGGSDDWGVTRQAVMVLAELADGDRSSKAELVKANAIPQLVLRLGDGGISTKHAALALAKMANEDQTLKAALLGAGVVGAFARVLERAEVEAEVREVVVQALEVLKRFEAQRDSERAGISVAYVLSDEFLALAQARSGEDDPTFYDLKAPFFFGEDAIGRDQACPRDGRSGCAFVDTLPEEHRQSATHFFSWSWAYRVSLVRSALRAWTERAGLDPRRTFLFMCFFVNNQHRILKEKAGAGSHNLEEVFESNLRRIGKVVALLDAWDRPVYLTRIWTIYEQFSAIKLSIPVHMILPKVAQDSLVEELRKGESGIQRVRMSLAEIDSQRAEAYCKEDEDKVKDMIRDHEGSFGGVNDKVKAFMRKWIVQTFNEFLLAG